MNVFSNLLDSRKDCFIACSVFCIIVALYSLTIPFAGAPDENTHLFYVEYLYRFHHIPRPNIDPVNSYVGDLSGFRYDSKTFWYYGIPDLYAFGGFLYAYILAKIFPFHFGFLAVRAFNWSLAPVFMYSMIAIASYCGLRRFYLWVVVLSFCSIPQITFIFTYFNSDALALTTATVALALCLGYLRFQKIRFGVSLGIALGIVSCTKVYFFPAILYIAIIMVFASFWSSQGRRRQILFVAIPWSVFILVSFPINYATYRVFGDFTGMTGQYHDRDSLISQHQAFSMCFALCDGKIVNIERIIWWITWAFESFFAVLGWMNVYVPNIYYTAFFLPLVLAVFFGNIIIIAIFNRSSSIVKSERAWIVLNFVLFWCMTIGVIASNIYGSQKILPQPQGRYLFVIIPFAVIQVASILTNWNRLVSNNLVRQIESYR